MLLYSLGFKQAGFSWNKVATSALQKLAGSFEIPYTVYWSFYYRYNERGNEIKNNCTWIFNLVLRADYLMFNWKSIYLDKGNQMKSCRIWRKTCSWNTLHTNLVSYRPLIEFEIVATVRWLNMIRETLIFEINRLVQVFKYIIW